MPSLPYYARDPGDAQTDSLATFFLTKDPREVVNSKTRKVTKSRLKDASSAYEIYQKMVQDDLKDNRNRAKIDAAFDGEAPYSTAEQVAAGRGDACNIDMGEAFAEKEAAMTAYYNLIFGVDKLALIQTDFGDESERIAYNEIIAEEFHNLVTRLWPDFHYRYILLCEEFVKHGVSFAYFEDEVNYQWNVTGWKNFKIPKMTPASDNKIEIAVITRAFMVDELWSFIQDRKAATAAGWNYDVTVNAILNACQVPQNRFSDWELLQQELKNNALWMSQSQAEKVYANHYLIKEFDGSYSHFIGPQYGSNTQIANPTSTKDPNIQDFMFKKMSRFNKASNAFISFTFGVGDGFFHSIRGLGYKIFDNIQLSNKIYNHLFDSVMRASSVVIQPNTADDMQNLQLTYLGSGITVMPPGVQFIPNAIPAQVNNLLPVVEQLTRIRQNNTGSYASRQVTPEGSQERTAFEVQAQLNQQTVLTEAALDLFYVPWEKLLNEMFNRVKSSKYKIDSPGGEEVYEFYKRCQKRSVPMEAIRKVSTVRANRAIGSGSPARRFAMMQQIQPMVQFMDEVGKNCYARDYLSTFGNDPNKYIPAVNTKARPPIDHHIAAAENWGMQMGKQAEVLPNDIHLVHADVHLSDMAQMALGQKNGQVDEQTLVGYLSKALPHAAQHVQMATGQMGNIEELGKAKDALEGLMKVFNQVAQQMQAKQQKAQMEQMKAQQEQAQQPQMDPQMMIDLAKNKLNNDLALSSAQTKQQIQMTEAKQRMALKDAEHAQKMQIAAQSAKTKKPKGS